MSDGAAGAESSADSAGPSAAGAVLFKERRRQGLSLGDISRQLKLSVRQVEALERDDYSGYKGPVFIHGFIRNYAKLLGLDPEPLIRATDSMLDPPATPVVAPREQERAPPMGMQTRKFRLWPAVMVVLVAGIAMSVYFGSRSAPETDRSKSKAAARDKAGPSSKAAATARAGADAKARAESKAASESAARSAPKPEAKQEAKPEVQTETRAASAERNLPVETGAAVAAEPAGRVTVRMIFEQDSWVEIKDRAGSTIFGQLNAAGSRRVVSGEPPLTVVVGNAAGVRLFLGDKNIDLAPHTRVDVARLKLE